ncbi:DEAD/DEAH box helicase [Aureimonas leprariae]|uniref:DEAD/DEAH box helicase n=1 Tax=Plantimonas leprariae TaxID=2615207 RepID=A0A7V7PNH7_9HYPH|nr:DEAD/DEAH box helicase [Aureimonas leprariae]KAB0679307.1 DEAD/DEAH box helicase [Aureimonas leprariae]
MPFRPMFPPLARALAERGFAEPTPVQDRVTEGGTEARDLLVSAQTGSGKTVAYGIAVAGALFGEAETLGPAGDPAVLVVAPTRELALQVAAELGWLYGQAGARIVTCVGGMDPRAEKRRLDDGAHVVVGTPGRLRDHLERRALRIGSLRALVLDEADEMLNLGFREDLEFILEATPAERRTLLFSATLPKAIQSMAERYQRNALRIEVKGEASGHADIEYRAVRIVPNEMEHAVVNVLRFEDSASAIVFCRTREAVRHLHSNLVERGFTAVALSGELTQSERNGTMQALRDGRARVCVATDVAARGIDLPRLGLVIHADLPNDAEVLQHRSGRTGRAGRKGVSVLLVPMSRRRKAERLLAEAGLRAKWEGAPTADAIRERDDARLAADPLIAAEPSEEEAAAARALLANRSPEAVAAALVRLYRDRLPAPEEVFDPGFRQDERPVRPPRHEADGEGGRTPRAKPGRQGAIGPAVWFRLDIGRRNEADPKWLLPLLCRRGRVSRDEIGAIKIYDRETKFEVAAGAAQRFAEAARETRGGSDEDGIAITQAEGNIEARGGGGGRPFAKGKGKPFRDNKPFGEGRPPSEGRPFRADKPAKRPFEKRGEGVPKGPGGKPKPKFKRKSGGE